MGYHLECLVWLMGWGVSEEALSLRNPVTLTETANIYFINLLLHLYNTCPTPQNILQILLKPVYIGRLPRPNEEPYNVVLVFGI